MSIVDRATDVYGSSGMQIDNLLVVTGALVTLITRGMIAMVQFITEYESLLTLLTSLGLCILTGTYVLLTYRLLSEAKKDREPLVIVEITFPDQVGRLVVTNIGKSPACNIRFNIQDSSAWTHKEHSIDKLFIAQRGISYLGPNRSLQYWLSTLDPKTMSRDDTLITIRIDYSNESGNKYSRTHVFDLKDYMNVLFTSFRDSSEQIAQELKGIKTELGRKRTRGSSIIMRSKLCPHCREAIAPDATRCYHCHSELDPSPIAGPYSGLGLPGA